MSQKSKIKPVEIFPILDLALQARKLGKTFVPLFSGDPGVGKSEIGQAWVKLQQKRNPSFGMFDLRLAYLEAPDVVGLPKVCSETHRTQHVLPEFWPTTGEGLIMLEEPNRANSSVMNTMMQLLTDRKVHNYKLPEGWIIASFINPENNQNDVNTMDLALRNRFVIYNVGYDHKSFIEFIKKEQWNPTLIGFIQSGGFVFKSSDEIGDQGFYISPRTLSMLNTAMLSGIENYDEIFYSTVVSILGDAVGRDFYKWVKNVRPLTAHDFIEDEKDAFKRLKVFCDKDSYKGDIVNILLDSITDNFGKFKEINIELVCKIMLIIPKDQVFQLGQGIVQKTDLKLEDFIKQEPKLRDAVKNSLREEK